MSDVSTADEVSAELNRAAEIERRFARFVERAREAGRTRLTEAGIRALVGDGSANALDEVDALIPENEVKDNELAKLLFEEAHTRPLGVIPKWLAAVPNNLSIRRDAVDAATTRIAERIWVQYASESPRPLELAKAACDGLARVTAGRNVAVDLTPLFEDATGSVALEPDALSERRGDIELAQLFVSHGYATDSALADLVVDDLVHTLGGDAPTDPEAVATHVLECFVAAQAMTSDATLTKFAAAVDEVAHLSEQDQETLQLAVVAARRMRRRITADAGPGDELVARVAANGTRGSRALGLWLEAFRPSPDRAWAAVKRAVRSGDRVDLSRAVAGYSASLPRRQRLDFQLKACTAFVRRETSERALEVIPLSESNEDDLASGLVRLAAREATTNEARRRILAVCRAADFETPAAVTKVVRGILVPSLKGNKGTATVALRYVDLARDVPAALTAAQRAMRSAVRRHPTLLPRALRVAERVGIDLSRRR